MAKSKSKKKNKSGKQQPNISPEKFIRDKARTLPLGKCFITPDWQTNGIADIVITRVRPSGNLIVGIYLVDTFCMGVKDVKYFDNLTDWELNDIINRMKRRSGIEEISYDEAHNIIYGAISFAEEGGINPAKEFDIASYILEEDTEDIPLIDYEFGKNGKHFLIARTGSRESLYINILRKHLGDNFDFLMDISDYDESDYEDEPDNSDDDFDKELSDKNIMEGMKNWNKMMEESNRHPAEVYSYQYPEYPQNLSVKNQFIADELMSKDNVSSLPRNVIEQILALPADEAAEDLSNIILFEIGRTYKAINDDTICDLENSAIMHALLLLTQLRSEKGLDAVLELMRQNEAFAEYHLGDFAPEFIHPALYACGKDNIPAVEKYLYTPGFESYLRTEVPFYLTMIAYNHPERREEIIGRYRILLNSLIKRLPVQEACDGSFAGFVASNIIDLKATELIPEIKALFATDCVDKSIAGDCDAIIKEIESDDTFILEHNYKYPDIYEQYDRIKQLFSD